MVGTKKRIVIISIVICLIVALLGLRVYGAYQNAKLAALASAAQAEGMAVREKAEADRLQRELDCSKAWQEYEIALLDARFAQLKRGDVAYYKAKAKAEARRPQCGSGSLSLDTFTNYLNDQLEHYEHARVLHAYSELLKNYATNRKLQTSYIAHKLWLTLTGTHPAQDDLTKFLAKNQPKTERMKP
jgi:hypothetical protein